jgi:mRNA interferase RelE/StbE
MFNLIIKPHAERDMRRLDRSTKGRIITAIRTLVAAPRPANCRKVEGRKDLWRLRVGDWRIGYLIDDTAREVTILWVSHRREAYKRNS